MDEPLPEYDAPPIDEVVLGVSFPSLTRWEVPYFGIYWNKIRDDYPHFATVPPLPSIVPRPLDLMSPNFIRCWFVDNSQNHLIQVQPNWFICNWRRITGNEVYPHYTSLRPNFEKQWERFLAFLESQQLEVPKEIYCETTYQNVIELPENQPGVAGISQITNLLSERAENTLLTAPNSISVIADYIGGKIEGSLRIQLNPAIRNRDNKTVIQLNLTVKGRPKSPETPDILAWMDTAREWIVRAFTDATTEKMHQLWRRK